MRNHVNDADILLIRELVRDGRVSLSKLAKITGLAYTTIRERLERLRERRLLEIKPLVSSELIGNNAAFLRIKCRGGIYDIARRLALCNRILSVMTTRDEVIATLIGSSKIELTVVAENIVSRLGSVECFEITFGVIPGEFYIPLKNPNVMCGECSFAENMKCNGCLPILRIKSRRRG